MTKIILTTPEELTGLIEAAIGNSLKGVNEAVTGSTGNMLTIDDAVRFLRSQGFATSKGTIYSLTSSGKLPHKKFGNKLIFDRTELLEWAHSQVVSAQKSSDLAKTLLGRKK